MKTKFRLNFFIFLFVLISGSLSMAGCAKIPEARTYQEVFIDKKSEMSTEMDNPHDMFQNMPDDAIHAGLRNGNVEMPSSDPHAFLQNMPDDDIHTNLGSGNMSLPPGMTPEMFSSGSASSLNWDTPKEWLEKKGNGMRLATFISSDNASPIETTIISLPGETGGLTANVSRWMGQLKMDVLSNQVLEEFISRQEKLKTRSGLFVFLVDFTELQKKADPETPSMIAAIIETRETKIFVKMMGEKRAVVNNSKPFKSLVQSIRMNSSP